MKNNLLLFLLLISLPSMSQWNNRYPKVDGYGHHVYLEAFELPVLNSGPTDAAPSPDGSRVAFASHGYLWVLDLSSGIARQITNNSAVDARPNWSEDGRHLVFVRDNGMDTRMMLLDLENDREEELVNTDRMELDPIFSADGNSVIYSSAANGSFDLWEINLSSCDPKVITQRRSLERLPVPVGDGTLLYLKKQGFSYDHIERINRSTGKIDTLVADNFVSQAAFTLSPDNRTIAYTWPHINEYEIRLIDLERPAVPLILTKTRGLPLWPKFSSDGEWIYYTEFDDNERAGMYRVHISGAQREKVEIRDWEWKAPVRQVRIITRRNGASLPTRLSVTSESGHPVIPESGTIHSEGPHGHIFFYSPGEITMWVPEGKIKVLATHGFDSAPVEQEVVINAESAEVTLDLPAMWDAAANGWYAGDNHFHLNYGGAYRLSPEDIIPEMQGEGMDVAFPLVANIHNRYLEEDLFGWHHDEGPHIQFGQEVRSHFLGHLNLIGTDSLFWPWIWGPSYDVYGRDDRTNAEAVRFAREQGGMAGYVHPVGNSTPFVEGMARGIPVELIADCVLGECDMIEVGCLWTDEIGTAEVWHELMNLGIPVALSAGSDVMNDYYRTMAIGATRLYVKPDGPLSVESYLAGMKAGKSFVTNGPQLEFKVEGQGPGGLIEGDGRVSFTFDAWSPVNVEQVTIFVNGKPVWEKSWNKGAEHEQWRGSIRVPEGGWITARVSGGETAWPMMDSYPFAETSPVWIGRVGSTDPESRKTAASRLLAALEVAYQTLKAGYGENPIPKLEAQFEEAREKLEEIAN
ncbi:MAG: CehA/McbA family metallohydrolase [Cyclobacteriaceae bacterium]